MKLVKMFGAAVAGFILLASTPLLADIVGDDFNNNTKDPAKWGGDMSFGTGSNLQEANGHLQFSGNGAGGIVRPWTYSYGSYTSNWEVAADVHVGDLSLNENDEIEMFLAVAPQGLDFINNHFVVSLSFGLDSSGNWRGYGSQMMTNGIDVGEEVWDDTADLQGRVRITFDATTKMLAAYYNGNPLGSNVVDSSWGATGFQIALGGSFGNYTSEFPANMTYSEADVYADNFSFTTPDVGYLLNVNSGTGSGSYTNGTRAPIIATSLPNMVFDRWVGATQYIASVTSTSTFVTMPASNIMVAASYTAAGNGFIDDFNDNAKDTAKWGADISFGTGNFLTETNSRLQFSVNGAGGFVRLWTYSYGSYTSNWEVAADVHVGDLSLNENEEIEMFLAVAPRGGELLNNHFVVSLRFGLDTSTHWRCYASQMMTNGTDVGEEVRSDTTDLQGRVRFTFDATTKMLAAYYNGNPLGSHVVPSSWGTTGFQIALGGSGSMNYSGSDVYADNFALTDTSISPADESAIRTSFAAAIVAYNAKNAELFAARISDAYLDGGDTKTSMIAKLQSPDWQSMSYTMDTPLYAGAGLASAFIHWGTGEIELMTFRKEGATWLLYGDQNKYWVDFYTSHNADNYSLSLSLEDSANIISSVEVAGPGLANTISLNYQSGGSDQSPSWVSWGVGGTTSNLFSQFAYADRPAVGAEYTVTIHETNGCIVTQTSRITGYVENFATALSPADGSTITNTHPVFSWSDGGYSSKVQLFMISNGDTHEFVWEPDTTVASPLTYNGPELKSGTHYCLYFQLMDGFGNYSIIPARFLYQAAGSATPPDSDADGIPDSWEQQYFGGTTNANPNAVCSNGFNTVFDAYIAGLNPTNPLSRFMISNFRALGDDKAFDWNTVSGRIYSVYWTTNLLSGFQPLEINIPWTRNSFTNSTIVPQSFYKINVQLED